MFRLLRENIHIALASIRGQLLRTILTVVIIGFGIMALVGILSAVNALENTISSDFASMGANTFNIRRYEFTVQRHGQGEQERINPIISYREVREFVDKFNYPFSQVAISFYGTTTAEVRYDQTKTDPEVSVVGANENYLTNSGLKLESGRDFNAYDIQNNHRICILGSDFKSSLFNDADPTGKTISIRGNRFQVIGILESKGSTFGNNLDLRVLIPINIARSIYTAPDINYDISIKTDDKQMLQGAQDAATVLFRNVRDLAPVELNNFGIERSDSLVNQIFELTGFLNIAAWIISIITIFGSSIALMNIMLVSVSERTREIGLRKSLGATRHVISTQFFIETILIAQIGGALGILLGMLIGWGISSLAEFVFTIPWIAIFWAVAISFVIAMVSGVYPATKAARLDPIEALRYE